MDPEPQIGPVNRHPIGCLGGAAVWLLLTFALPKPYGEFVCVAGLISYAVWVILQEHNTQREWGFSSDGSRRRFRSAAIDLWWAELERQLKDQPTILVRPAERPDDTEQLLRPAEGSGESDPDKLLRPSDPKREAI